MSIQFGVAAALQLGTVEACGYHRLEDAGILRLVARTRLEVDETLTARFPTAQGAEVRVSLEDGSLVMDRLHDVVPATGTEIRVRFREAAAQVIGPGRANEIQACVDRLETETDAGRLASLCSLVAPTGAAHKTQSRAGRSRR